MKLLTQAVLFASLMGTQAFAMVFPPLEGGILPDISSAIYQGSPFIENGQISKYTVNLILGEESCTGVFIDRNAILTAAHCQPKTKGQIEIHRFIGSDPLLVETVAAKDYVMVSHPKYATSKKSVRRGYDLAVISLKPGAIAQTFEIPLMALPSDFASFQAGSTVYTVGAGDNGYGESDGKLYYTKGVIDAYESSNVVRIINQNGQLCSGDSGGPSFVISNGKSRLIGITSGVSFDDEDLDCGTVMVASFLSMENAYWVGTQVLRGDEYFLKKQYAPILKKGKIQK